MVMMQLNTRIDAELKQRGGHCCKEKCAGPRVLPEALLAVLDA